MSRIKFLILFFIVHSASQLNAQFIDGIIGYWKFDELNGQIARDEISSLKDSIHYINYIEPSNDPPRRPGILNQSMVFDGFSTWIERPQEKFESQFADLSISVWVAPRAFEHGAGEKISAIVNQQDPSNKAGFALGIYRHGSWSFQTGTGDQWLEIWDEGNPLPRRQWSFLTCTYDASSGRIGLYMNGKPISGIFLDKARPITTAVKPLLIGRHNQNEVASRGGYPLNMFNGLMDELIIYNRALSEDEISNLYSTYLEAHDHQIPVIPYADIMIDRSKYENDPYRPEFHASPPGHWMNEPHAPFFYNGKYHLMYQHNPTGPYWGQIHWGHWVSDDLVHWYDVPEAIFPENDTIAPDGIWSGCATFDKDGAPILFYTFGNWSKNYSQGVAMARPADLNDPDLVKWNKYPRPTITQKPGQAMMAEFRDPFAWNDPDEPEKWYMLIGSGQRGPTVEQPEGTAWFYESKDLYNWQLLGEFYKTDFDKYPEMAGIWELPVILPIGKYPDGKTRYIFMCSPVVRGLVLRYLVGRINKENSCFVPDDPQPKRMNYGGNTFTAPSGMVDPKTGRVIVFTLAHGGSGPGWSGNMGLPVEINFDKDNELLIKPIIELESLRIEELINIKNKNIEYVNKSLESFGGNMIEILLEIEPGDATRYGINVCMSDDSQETTIVYYDAVTASIGVDLSRSTLNSESTAVNLSRSLQDISGPLDLKEGNLRLHIYIDKSILEVYANDHRAITARMYPSLKESTGLRLFSDGDISIRFLKVWKMDSIYYH